MIICLRDIMLPRFWAQMKGSGFYKIRFNYDATVPASSLRRNLEETQSQNLLEVRLLTTLSDNNFHLVYWIQTTSAFCNLRNALITLLFTGSLAPLTFQITLKVLSNWSILPAPSTCFTLTMDIPFQFFWAHDRIEDLLHSLTSRPSFPMLRVLTFQIKKGLFCIFVF